VVATTNKLYIVLISNLLHGKKTNCKQSHVLVCIQVQELVLCSGSYSAVFCICRKYNILAVCNYLHCIRNSCTQCKEQVIEEEMNLNKLKKLNLPKDKFAIFGSGPLAVRGIRKSNDIDIIVKPELWKELKEKYKPKDRVIKIGKIEIYKDWLPWIKNTNKLIDDADVIKGFRFVKLKYVLQWKKAFARKKDLEDIELIKKYLQ